MVLPWASMRPRLSAPAAAKSGSSAATNNCASFEVSEPYPAGVPSATRTVWWSYAAPFDGVVRFDTRGVYREVFSDERIQATVKQ